MFHFDLLTQGPICTDATAVPRWSLFSVNPYTLWSVLHKNHFHFFLPFDTNFFSLQLVIKILVADFLSEIK